MKDAVICFRISKDLRRVLESISETNRRSLSATIENILHSYAEQRGRQAIEEERRRYPRKRISAPALLSGPDGSVHGGIVNDVSLGGLSVSFHEGHEYPTEDGSRLSVVFALPESDRPLTMQCIMRHVQSNGSSSIGASFIDGECEGGDILGHYLVH
jgi:hypothetical protein